jgi:hypothetical protein
LVKRASWRDATRAPAVAAKLEDKRQRENNRILAARAEINDDMLAKKTAMHPIMMMKQEVFPSWLPLAMSWHVDRKQLASSSTQDVNLHISEQPPLYTT